MYVRLGFAIAAHVDCDIMLVDEVLSVGDAEFSYRSLERMRELQRNGVTVFFVSHNMHLVRQVCSSSLLLVRGQVQAIGQTPNVIDAYERLMLQEPGDRVGPLSPAMEDGDRGGLVLRRVWLRSNGSLVHLPSESPADLEIEYATGRPTRIGRIDVRIVREDSILCCTLDSTLHANCADDFSSLNGYGTITISFPALQLTTGVYRALVQVTDAADARVIASAESGPFAVHARGSGPDRGVYVPVASWTRTESQGPTVTADRRQSSSSPT
jgi:lipopolysaccharide transport system ATP-binding protein